MKVSSKRAEQLAWAAFALSLVFFAVTFSLGRWSGFFALSAAAWLILAGVLIWFVLAVQFHQRSLAEQEKLDMTQLAAEQDSSTIFEGKGRRADLFAVAQRRLNIFEKWFIPIFSTIIAVYQIALGFLLLRAALPGAETETRQPLVCAASAVVIAFLSFLFSRYATGMSTQPQWRPLRAGGSFLLGIALVFSALAAAIIIERYLKLPVFLQIVEFAICIMLVILGTETGLNLILDIYRPRLKGRYSRTAFDSRLLGVINEPGGIFRSLAAAIDYQFGFKVSQTWFYKLLQKAVVPLVLFAGLTLYLLSCIVIVSSDEEAIIERFGNPIRNGRVRLVGPGITFKWPAPIDVAKKYPTKKIRQINVGFVPETDPKTGRQPAQKARLWGKAHYKEEYDLLVATEQMTEKRDSNDVPVSLITAAVPVHYRVKDLHCFLYRHKDAEKLLESLCYRELTRFAGSAKVELEQGSGRSRSILGAGRAEAKEILTSRVQAAADRENLGVEIVFLGLQGLHPPQKVAPDYQKVVTAVQQKQSAILDAQTYRIKSLAALVGSARQADSLATLAAQYQRARKANPQEQHIDDIAARLDQAFEHASGEIFQTLRQSKTYAFEKATLAQATENRFAAQLKAYNAAPDIYKHHLKLAVLEDVLADIRKYILIAEGNQRQRFDIDLKEKLTPGLLELGGLAENSEE